MINLLPSSRLFILVPLLLFVVAGSATGFALASGPSRAEGFWASWEAAGRPSLAMIAEFRSRKEASEWPPFTMVYDLEHGQAVMVGNRQIDPRQMRRMVSSSSEMKPVSFPTLWATYPATVVG